MMLLYVSSISSIKNVPISCSLNVKVILTKTFYWPTMLNIIAKK